MEPPTTIFYAETGGKSAPFYRTLGGIKSAFKTTRNGWDRPKVYRGVVEWHEIDPDTGLPLQPHFDTAEDRLRRMNLNAR